MMIENLRKSWSQQIKNKAEELGFDRVGIIPVSPGKTIDIYSNWLKQGYAGRMDYLHKHLEKKRDVRHIMPETLSLVALAINYYTTDLPEKQRKDPSLGIISRYAWGQDYHDIVRKKLEELRSFIQEHIPSHHYNRVYVDTGPILEREYAYQAGLGWFGKHSNLIHWKKGSWFFLAEILMDVELDYENPPVLGSCGTCTLCIEACPTQAIVADQTIDSRLCISYLTIELKGSIPLKLRSSLNNLIFGCDICQEVCPWNRKAIPTKEKGFYSSPETTAPELTSLMSLTQKEFSRRFKGSPIKRTKRRGLLRNTAVALGNWGNPKAIPALKLGLQDHEPLIRSHSAWALGQISFPEAKQILKEAQSVEKDEEVLQEISQALSNY